MKIITVVGARPQFIKASILSKLFIKNSIEEIIIHTGQHFDLMMSDIFFKELNIPEPKYNLNINSLNHGAMTGRMLEKIEEILIQEKPDLVIVYGDTNSTLAGALAASKLHIPIAHIESGLRSFNNLMPEETNRKLTDHISNYCFCPSDHSVINLKNEGVKENKIFRVGDIMCDVFYTFMNLSEKEHTIGKSLKVEPKKYCLLTLHREENTKNYNDIYALFICLKKISDLFGYNFLFPMHPRLEKFLLLNNFHYELFKNIIFLSPVSYLDMVDLEMNARIILTDSGGVQKEAFWSRVPCLTLREETEWVETVYCGYNRIVGLDPNKIFIGFKEFLETEIYFRYNLYGEGNSGQKILNIIKNQTCNSI